MNFLTRVLADRRRRIAGLAALFAVLGAVLLGPAAATGHAAPNPEPSENPCDLLEGTPAYEICTGGEEAPDGPKPGDPTGLAPECKGAPMPAIPGRGAASWAQQPPRQTPAPIDPGSDKAAAHIYEQYGLAGFQWHTYDLDCSSPGDTLTMMNVDYETQVANWILDASNWWTGLAIGLQQEATGDGYIKRIDKSVAQATGDITEAIYKPWIGISVLVLGLGIVYGARKKDMGGTVQSVGWALLVMAVTSVAFQYPTQASSLADTVITETVGRIQQGVAGDLSKGSDPQTAHGNLMAHSVLYEGWLRGEFGDADSKVAKKYGMPLLDAQTLTWAEAKLPPEERQKIIEAKQKKWAEIAAKVKEADPQAYEHLTGRADGRLSAAFETALGATPANFYSFAANATITAGRLILKLLVVFLPAIAPIAIHRRMSGSLRSLGMSAGAVLINVPLLVLGGSIQVLFVKVLLGAGDGLPTWFGVVLLWVLTTMLWVMTKPFRRLNAMVSPNRHWFGEGVGFLSKGKAAAGAAVLGYAKGRMSARQIGKILGGPAYGAGGAHTSDVDDDGAEASDGGQQQGRPVDYNDHMSEGASRDGEGPETGDGYWPDYDNWPLYGRQQSAGDVHDGALVPVFSPSDLDSERDTIPAAAASGPRSAPSGPVPGPRGSATAGGATSSEGEGYPPTGNDSPGRSSGPATDTAAAAGAPADSLADAAARYVAARQRVYGTLGTPSAAGGSVPYEPPPADQHEGDRPAPYVAPSVTEEDGTVVYQVFSPTAGFSTHRADPAGSASTPTREED